MKTFTRLFTMLAVAAFVAAGCVNEEPPYKEEPKPTPGDATGFLSVSGLSMRVVYDETDVRPDDTSDQTQSPQAVSGTRAEQPDVDGFIVEILDADDAQYCTDFDRNLLYVALTRALHKLTVLYRTRLTRFLV